MTEATALRAKPFRQDLFALGLGYFGVVACIAVAVWSRNSIGSMTAFVGLAKLSECLAGKFKPFRRATARRSAPVTIPANLLIVSLSVLMVTWAVIVYLDLFHARAFVDYLNGWLQPIFKAPPGWILAIGMVVFMPVGIAAQYLEDRVWLQIVWALLASLVAVLALHLLNRTISF